MKSFTNALSQSLKYGKYKSGDTESVITFMLKNYDVTFYDDDSGNPWMEFCSTENGKLFALAHSVYKIVFIKSDMLSKNNGLFHVENVESFDKQEWFIDDFIEFKNTFASMHWDESEHVVDPSKFSLLDMRFATE